MPETQAEVERRPSRAVAALASPVYKAHLTIPSQQTDLQATRELGGGACCADLSKPTAPALYTCCYGNISLQSQDNHDADPYFQLLHLLSFTIPTISKGQEKTGWIGRNVFKAPQLITSEPGFSQQ